MTVTDIVRAASAFQGEISGSYWEEHGISDEEAARGMLAAMQALGFCDGVSAAKIQAVWKRYERKQERKRALEAKKRWDAMTPEQQESQRLMNEMMATTNRMMMDSIMDQVFSSNNSFMSIISGKSPNTESYT